MSETINAIIPFQIPIVAILAFLSYQASIILKLSKLKFVCYAWIANSVYLFLSLLQYKDVFLVGELNHRILTTFIDLISSFFFIVVAEDLRILSKFKKLKIRVIIFIILVAFVLLQIWPIDPVYELSKYLHIRNIPFASINCLSLVVLSTYFKNNIPNHKAKRILFYGCILYAVIQVLQVIEYRSDLFYLIGFSLGTISKLMILAGLFKVLLHKAMEKVEKEKVVKRLVTIIGTMYHEVKTPLRNIERLIDELKNDPRIVKRIDNSLFNLENEYHQLFSIVNASVKLYENETLFKLDSEEANDDAKLEFISINTLIDVAILHIKPSTEERIVFKKEYSGNCNVLCYPKEIIQVFANLFRNADESISEAKVSLGIVKIKTINARVEASTEEEKRVVIYIEDNGSGVNDKVKGSLFEKGITTKLGMNRGYGLWVCRELLSRIDGTIRFESPTENGKGTKFIITLPRVISQISSLKL